MLRYRYHHATRCIRDTADKKRDVSLGGEKKFLSADLAGTGSVAQRRALFPSTSPAMTREIRFASPQSFTRSICHTGRARQTGGIASAVEHARRRRFGTKSTCICPCDRGTYSNGQFAQERRHLFHRGKRLNRRIRGVVYCSLTCFRAPLALVLDATLSS
nr:hypothetical protein CFP56_04570 [Quercus suber]POE63677.1 hypothetical protein CFP56_04580 [Quercus suber]